LKSAPTTTVKDTHCQAKAIHREAQEEDSWRHDFNAMRLEGLRALQRNPLFTPNALRLEGLRCGAPGEQKMADLLGGFFSTAASENTLTVLPGHLVSAAKIPCPAYSRCSLP
jgi:hypothetical protein